MPRTARLLSGALTSLWLFAPDVMGAAQDSLSFRANVDAVQVDVSVANGSRPVQGLTAANFELLDNGVPQRIEVLSFDHIPLNVVLAFDLSASVAGERLLQLQHGGAALVDALAPDDQAALVTFDQRVRLAATLSLDRRRLLDALHTATGSGDTALANGIYAAMTVGENAPGRSLVIVFTDGMDTLSWLTGSRLADAVKRSDAVIYAATTKSRTKPAMLSEITELTGGRLHQVDRYQDLKDTFLKILEEFRTRYLLTYSPAGVAPGGWHRLEVRVKGRRATVRARPGYLAGP